MTTFKKIGNRISTTIKAGSSINNSDDPVTFNVTDATDLPAVQFYITIEQLTDSSVHEIMLVTGIDGDELTATRAQDGTTKQTFSAGDLVQLRVIAAHIDEITGAVNDIEDGTTLDSRYLQIANNLSDLNNVSAALGNLGLSTNLADLTDGEVEQLENIGATTISADQWGYLGSMSGQPIETETDPIVGAISGIVKADGGGNISAAVADTDYQSALTFGIANTNAVQIDHASVADNDYAKFTASGLEGRSYSEVLGDLSGQAGSAFDFNSQNLTSVGTINSGAITATSFGGITSANLLDKTANETISGTWDFNTNLTVGDGTDITPDDSGSGQLMIDGNAYAGFIALNATGMYVGNNSKVRTLEFMTDETSRMSISGGGRISFATFPTTPSSAPDADYEVANKKYVDDNAGGGSTYVSESDALAISADTERNTASASYTKLKEISFYFNGTLRIKFDMRHTTGDTNAKGIIYKNGVAYGTERSSTSTSYITYSEDLAFVAGDKIQLYARVVSAGYGATYIRNFRIYYDTYPEYVVNTD
jgi:hypothetical protein